MSDARNWSRYQAAIFDAVEAGAVNIQTNAVAGSGKTSTIVEAANRLRGREALFCAFNKHTAETLKHRLPSTVTASTIHGLGYRTLRAIGRLGAPDTAKYRDKSSEFVWSLSSEIYGNMPTVEQRKRVGETLRDALHFCRVNLTDPGDRHAFLDMALRYDLDVDNSTAKCYAAATKDLLDWGVAEATTKGRIDFDDMLWLPWRLRLRPRLSERVFVDEQQDLSRAQLDLVLSSLAPGSGRIVGVGDPRQSIYFFAGADAQAFSDFRLRTAAVELPLSICYRCPSSVVDLAREYVPQIEAAPGAMAGLVTKIKHEEIFATAQAGDLLLSRTTARAIKDCLTFLAMRRPCRVRGRDIGKKLVGLVDKVRDNQECDFADFGSALTRYVEWKTARLLATKGGEAQIESLNDMAEAVGVCFGSFNADSWGSFRAQLEDLFADSGEVIWISTIHRAKGLENARVFILDFDRLPLRWKGQTDEQFAQERNLIYVAITRAMSVLYLVEGEAKDA